MRKQNVLKNTQDFVIIEKIGRDSYVYVAKPSLDVMRQFYEQSIANPDDKNIDAFDRYWQFDEKKGIIGSSTFLTLRFDKQSLRPNGLWIPGVLEAKALESQGKLENGVYRDYGVAVYSDNKPNKEVAKTLVSQTKQLGLELPLIVPFRDLDYVQNKDRKNEVELFLLNSGKGIIQGKEAQNKINSLDYKGNSGVQRLYRDRVGDWNAYWSGFADSYGDGRVDWVCGIATTQNLERAVLKGLNEVSRSELEKLNTKIANSKEAALKILRS